MIWTYYINTPWEEEKMGHADVYLFDSDENRDINEESISIKVDSLKEQMTMIDGEVKMINNAIKDGEKEVIMIHKSFDIKGTVLEEERVTINYKDYLKSSLKKRKDLEFKIKDMEEKEEILIDTKENVIITVDLFTKNELMNIIETFISEAYEDESPIFKEGVESEFVGTNQSSVMDMIIKDRISKLEENGVFKDLDHDGEYEDDEE